MFKIVGRVCCLILLVVAIRLGGKLAESRQENEDLRSRLNSVVERDPADMEQSVAAEEENQAELVALKEALSTMNGEMEQLQKQSVQEREQVLRESAKERETLTTGIAEVLSQIGVSRKELETLLADLPAGDRLRLLDQITVLEVAAPVGVEEPRTTEVEVTPPPDDKPEEKMLVVPESEPATEESMDEDEQEFVTYTVKRGDTLSQIGRRFDVGVAEIMKLNGIVDARKLGSGQVLKIPQN